MTDYPYTYARVSAKRAKLLDSSDYNRLVKMEPNAIARNLEEGDYGKEINELGARYKGVELVELALNKNLSRTLTKIMDFAPQKLEKVINVYLRKYDIVSLKRIIRWKEGGEKGDISDLMVPAGSYSEARLQELSKMSQEELIRAIEFKDCEIDYQDYLENAETVEEVEKALDKAYFKELDMLTEKVKSHQFKRFIERELEFENLSTVLRLKKYGCNREEIESRMINCKNSDIVEEAISSENLDSAMNSVKKKFDLEDVERLEDLEHALEVQRLQKALTMLHTEPLGFTSILGYINAKIIEVKNLRMLIRAKETGVQNIETIKRNLVVA